MGEMRRRHERDDDSGGGCFVLILIGLVIWGLTSCGGTTERERFMRECIQKTKPAECADAWDRGG